MCRFSNDMGIFYIVNIGICTLVCPKKCKFCDYKMIFLLLNFISSTLRSSDAQKPKQKIRCAHAQIISLLGADIRNAAETYNIFSADFFWGKNMKIHKKFSVLKFPKIREKVFLQSLDEKKKKKRIYFRTLHHASFLLPSVMDFSYHPFRR